MKRGLLVLCAGFVLAAPASGGPPTVDARAYLVENGATGEVLLESRARARVPMASITKLMTVLVVLDRAKLDDLVTVSPQATRVGGSSLHLRPGERLTVRELVEGALIQSANDAADALALYVGRGDMEAFVRLMNARATKMGLTDTNFVRPDGLDAAGHVSSARDVTLLGRAAMQKPAIRAIVRQQSATIGGGRTLHTWNDLLGTFPGVVGVKTGHTSGAGWSEVAAARGRGFTIYATILGSASRSERNDDLAELLEWGLGRYQTLTLVKPGRVYGRVKVGYGKKAVELIANSKLVRVVRVGRPIVEMIVAPTVVGLPVERGRRLGEVRIYVGGRLVGTRPLVASRSVSRPGLVGRVAWYAGRTASHVWGWFW